MRIFTKTIIMTVLAFASLAHSSNYNELVQFGTSKWFLYKENNEYKHYVSIINNVYPDGSLPILTRTVFKKAAGKKELLEALKESTDGNINLSNFKHMVEFDIVNCYKNTYINVEYYFLDNNYNQLHAYKKPNATKEIYYIQPELRRMVCR